MDLRSILRKLSELDFVEQREVPEEIKQKLPQDSKLESMTARRSPVAKNINKFNKPATHRDRKKDMKAGKEKHKGRETEDSSTANYASIKEDLYQRLENFKTSSTRT
jgi:hypothetical protein